MKTTSLLRFFEAAFLSVIAAGCAYEPPTAEELAKRTSVPEAKYTIEHTVTQLNRNQWAHFLLDEEYMVIFTDNAPPERMRVDTVPWGEGFIETGLQNDRVYDPGTYWILGPHYRYWIHNEETFHQFVDALVVYRHGWPEFKLSQDAEFNRAVQTYAASAVKPTLDESVRRYQVQGEEAVRVKHFEDAVVAFNQALDLAPWWPEGHYNKALILAQIGAYSSAITEMKRFLALAPQAASARQARDQIYKWEIEVPAARPFEAPAK